MKSSEIAIEVLNDPDYFIREVKLQKLNLKPGLYLNDYFPDELWLVRKLESPREIAGKLSDIEQVSRLLTDIKNQIPDFHSGFWKIPFGNIDYDRLKKIRNQIGDTQTNMAKRLGVTARAYQFWESKERKIPTIAKILIRHICDDFQLHPE